MYYFGFHIKKQNFMFYSSYIFYVFSLLLILFSIGCSDNITSPENEQPTLDVVLSLEVYVLDKEFHQIPQPGIDLYFHEYIVSPQGKRSEEFYTIETCSKGWVIELRNYLLNHGEEIVVGVTFDSSEVREYEYKIVTYGQLIQQVDSSNSVTLLTPFTLYK